MRGTGSGFPRGTRTFFTPISRRDCAEHGAGHLLRWSDLQAVAASPRPRHLPLNQPSHLNPAVAHPHLNGRLWVRGRAAHGDAIREAIAARVPGADDAPILDPALVERTALMSASLE